MKFMEILARAVANPDLQIRGLGGHRDPEISGGRGGLKNLFFGPLGLSLV